MIDYQKYDNKDKDIIEFYGDILCIVIGNENKYLNLIIGNVSYVPSCDTNILLIHKNVINIQFKVLSLGILWYI